MSLPAIHGGPPAIEAIAPFASHVAAVVRNACPGMIPVALASCPELFQDDCSGSDAQADAQADGNAATTAEGGGGEGRKSPENGRVSVLAWLRKRDDGL